MKSSCRTSAARPPSRPSAQSRLSSSSSPRTSSSRDPAASSPPWPPSPPCPWWRSRTGLWEAGHCSAGRRNRASGCGQQAADAHPRDRPQAAHGPSVPSCFSAAAAPPPPMPAAAAARSRDPICCPSTPASSCNNTRRPPDQLGAARIYIALVGNRTKAEAKHRIGWVSGGLPAAAELWRSSGPAPWRLR